MRRPAGHSAPSAASAELVEGRLVGVAGFRHFFGEAFQIEAVGFGEIFERVAMVPQLGVEEAEEEVGVHSQVVGEVHGAEGWKGRRLGARESGRGGE